MESARWLKEKASNLIEAEAYDDAVPYLERLLKIKGAGPFDLSFAHFMLGEIALYNNRFRAAQTHLKDSMDITGEDSQALLLLGQAYLGNGKPLKARKALEKAVKLAPGEEVIELSLALSMCMTGDFEEAEKVYLDCIEKFPETPETRVGLAQSQVGQGKLDVARKTLEDAQQRHPLSLAIRRAFKELEKFQEASDFCDWLIHENPDGLPEDLVDPNEEILSWTKTVLVENHFPLKAIANAEKLWKDFARVGTTAPRFPDAWAGAVIYVMAKLYGRDDVSQKKIAARIGVPKSTISTNYRKIIKDLKIKEGDKRYLG